MKAGIADYRMGNLASVSKALERVGARSFVSERGDELEGADVLVLPGVGNFGTGMRNLTELGLDDLVRRWAGQGRPLVGICLGMQLLFDRSEEGDVAGLGILSGDVVRIAPGVKVPHMGWNEVYARGSELFAGSDGNHFYFDHSYVCVPFEDVTAATTTYGEEFSSAVRRDGIVGVQFHPEKSSKDGLALLERLMEAVA